MSALRALAARRTPLVSSSITKRAGFHYSIVRAAGKETHLHSEGRGEEVQEKKEDLLKKQKEGKGHWEESLASDSESIVKADRGEVEASEDTIKKLQEEAAKVANKKL
ncbi:hypothetical protein BU26DRAFT_512524 [Trematosphaeria pertusa]|uniref:Mitochondrial carrier protein pet8 n=1 Tax=Trematosphaeria pertusa TaxID=390896 RepID=A0A6A6J071_9PLEO|nr:uncharacterized protein BU26DRAFT_512524 [Trematosphaeria pertusa]KAF2255552.1 hypothetical protein BU26DRAFT_512524 [Trematosphaeria pertusa]